MNILTIIRTIITHTGLLMPAVLLIVACGSANSLPSAEASVTSKSLSKTDSADSSSNNSGTAVESELPCTDSLDTDTTTDTAENSTDNSTDNGETLSPASTVSSGIGIIPPPSLENAGAKTCTMTEPIVVGTSDKRLTNPDFWQYDIVYGVNGGLIVWPDGDVVRTRAFSSDGEPLESTYAVEMPGVRNIEVFAAGDRYLLLTQNTCRKDMIKSLGHLTPAEDSPRNQTMKQSARYGWNCTSMRLLDKYGKAIGPVSNYPSFRGLNGFAVEQLTSDLLVFCGGYYHSGPQCIHLNIGTDNSISASHVYSMEAGHEAVHDIFGIPSENNEAHWLLLTENDDASDDASSSLVLYRAGTIRSLQRNMLSSLFVYDTALTDNEMIVVSSAVPPCMGGSLYRLTQISLEDGTRVEEDRKFKRGNPIPPPFDKRVYFDFDTPDVYGSKKCTLRRTSLSGESVGESIRLPNAWPRKSHFSGRVLTIVYAEKTAPKEWGLKLNNVNCRP